MKHYWESSPALTFKTNKKSTLLLKLQYLYLKGDTYIHLGIPVIDVNLFLPNKFFNTKYVTRKLNIELFVHVF